MILDAKNVVHHLLERGLISASSVIQEKLRVTEVSSRHRNFKVSRDAAPGFFVKQVKNRDWETMSTLRKEGTCAWLAQNDPRFEGLNDLLAPFKDYDPAREILVLGLLSESERLLPKHVRQGTISREIARQLGGFLARVHREIPGPAGIEETLPFPRQPPPILRLHHASSRAWGTTYPDVSRLIQLVRSEPSLAHGLDALVLEWRTVSLIHGDIKWDNCLLFRAPGSNQRRLRLIDWELADIGDPDWDVGAVFQAFFVLWLAGLPLISTTNAVNGAGQGRCLLRPMQPAIRVFWTSYCEGSALTAEEQAQRLARVVRFAAGRLVQTSFEIVIVERSLSPLVFLLLQLSLNLFNRPEAACSELLGITT